MKFVARTYQILAWIVGLNLILVVTGFVGQKTTEADSWFNRNDGLITIIDVIHGWLFMVVLVLVVILAKHYRWSVGFMISTGLLATIPIVSFFAERRATRAINEAEASRSTSPSTSSAD